VWSYHSFAAWRWVCDNASSGFSGSSMTIRSAPRPVSHPADRGGDARALRGRLEFGHRLMARCEAGRREETLVPVAGEDAPAIARELVGQLLGTAAFSGLGRLIFDSLIVPNGLTGPHRVRRRRCAAVNQFRQVAIVTPAASMQEWRGEDRLRQRRGLRLTILYCVPITRVTPVSWQNLARKAQIVLAWRRFEVFRRFLRNDPIKVVLAVLHTGILVCQIYSVRDFNDVVTNTYNSVFGQDARYRRRFAKIYCIRAENFKFNRGRLWIPRWIGPQTPAWCFGPLSVGSLAPKRASPREIRPLALTWNLPFHAGGSSAEQSRRLRAPDPPEPTARGLVY
jgi:hypothetical protein